MCEFECRFQSDFKDNLRFSVDFALDRLPLRVQHRAVATVKPRNLVEVLFPTGKKSSHSLHLPRSEKLKVKNPGKTFKICDPDKDILMYWCTESVGFDVFITSEFKIQSSCVTKLHVNPDSLICDTSLMSFLFTSVCLSSDC